LVCRKDQIPRHSRTNKHTKRLKEMTQEEKDKTKEIQEKEKTSIRIRKETPIEVDKQMLDKVVDELHVMDTEQLVRILIEARKTRLLD
jgi:ribosomal protein S25